MASDPEGDLTDTDAASGGRVARLVVVTGLPRSGTSMAMRMLAAGGLGVVDDGHRAPGPANPHGWFEDARVRRLREDASWLRREVGRAVKIVLPLLPAVPADLPLDVLRLHRPLGEVLASQRRVLALDGPARSADAGEDGLLAAAFERAGTDADRWLGGHPDARVLGIALADALAAPSGTARRVAEFLALPLDRAAMASAIDPAAITVPRAARA